MGIYVNSNGTMSVTSTPGFSGPGASMATGSSTSPSSSSSSGSSGSSNISSSSSGSSTPSYIQTFADGSQLDTRTNTVVRGATNTTENQTANQNSSQVQTPEQVNTLYQQYFGRPANSGEIAYWPTRPQSELLTQLQTDYNANTPEAIANRQANPVNQEEIIKEEDIPFKQGMTQEQKNSIINLLNNKDISQWNDADKANWSTATGGANLPTSKNDLINKNINETPDLTDLFSSMIGLNPFLTAQLENPKLKAQFDSLDPSLKMQYLMNLKALGETIESGKIVNPNLDITEAETKTFEDQAKAKIAGYYDELIGYETGDLKTTLQRLKEDWNTNVLRSEEALKTGLKTQTEQEAQSGLAFSSSRKDRMSKTIKAQQDVLDDAALQMARKQQDLGTATERRIGSEAFNKLGYDYGTPQYSASTGQNEYGAITQSGTRTLFTPSGNLVGEIPKQREVDVINERNNLILAEKQKRILDASKLSGEPITDYSSVIETPKATTPTATATVTSSYITLPNGQRVSKSDPNIEEYKRYYPQLF